MKFKHFESSYQCEECIKSFKTKEKLQDHKEKIHGENPKISCQLCTELFRTKSDMRKHKTLIHKSSESHCSQCKKSFQGAYSVYSLELHIDQVKCTLLILEIFCKLSKILKYFSIFLCCLVLLPPCHKVFLFVVQIHMKTTNQNLI